MRRCPNKKIGGTDMIGILVIGLIFPAIMEIGLEEYRKRKSCYKYSYLSRHLKQAPYVFMAAFLLAVMSYHYISYRLSIYQITSYIYSDKTVLEEPGFDLHLIYRSFCGNANTANLYSLYADAAASGFDSPDPTVRAKSLLASLYVYDGLNHPNTGPFFKVINHAKQDNNPIVQKIFVEYDCSYFLQQ